MKKLTISVEIPKRLACSFCDGKLYAQTPSETARKEPNFRCDKCSVRVVITNQSHLPEDVRKYYWFLVQSQQLGVQEWVD